MIWFASLNFQIFHIEDRELRLSDFLMLFRRLDAESWIFHAYRSKVKLLILPQLNFALRHFMGPYDFSHILYPLIFRIHN